MNQANIIANIHDILLFLSRDALLRISPTCKCISGTAKQILPTYPHRIINATLSAQVKDTELTFRITSFKNNGHFQLRLYSNDSAVWENISIDDFDDNFEQRFYSFNDIRPYFPKYAHFSEAKVNIGQDMYSAYHIAIMESIAHMWADGKLALINTVSAEDDEKETQDKNTCHFSNIEILFHRIELFFGSNRRRRHSATNRCHRNLQILYYVTKFSGNA
ncbi:hypothetical protein Ddc_22231 [Ditylenchus destructor]|nr:hypothetical protein Ddc_22231 [Ditylenchus destructor]